MASLPAKYVCINPACENYFYTSKIILNNEETKPGDSNEKCCPKCGQSLKDYAVLLKEEDEARRRKIKRLLLISLGVIVFLVIAVVIFKIATKKNRPPHEQPSKQGIVMDTVIKTGEQPAPVKNPDPVPPSNPPHTDPSHEVAPPVKPHGGDVQPPQQPITKEKLEESFEKLTGHVLTLDQKEVVQSKILLWFTSNAIVHKTINNVKTGSDNIDTYLRTISSTPKNVTKTIKVETPLNIENGKIYVLYVQENYQDK